MMSYLHFSDAAKFADIARNIATGQGYQSSFNFFDPNKLSSSELFDAPFTPPAMPYAISFFFKLFGLSDNTVILTSLFFYLLTIIFVFLLSKRLFGKVVAILAAVAVATNLNVWDYASSGASEILFMLEVVAIPYFILIKKRWSDFVTILLLVLCYFTRPQSFIFISVFVLFFLLLRLKIKQALIYWLAFILAGLVIDRLVLLPLNGKYFLYSITGRGIHAVTQHTQQVAVSDVLRGVEMQNSSFISSIKKTSLNLFNFYRSIPQIINPYLVTLFTFTPLIFKKKEEKSFVAVVFMATILSFLLPAMTIPFYRYIHPVLPLIYILGTASLIAILRKFVKNKQQVIAISTCVVFFLVVGLSMGTYLHDLRYNNARSNISKSPIYVSLSEYLKNNTNQSDLVITNLDTWASWYGERKTMWFPLKPEMLESTVENIDAVYLTNYKIDDENNYMGEEWREIFNNPVDHNNEFFKKHFEFAGEFKISAPETYENIEGRAVLWTKRN